MADASESSALLAGGVVAPGSAYGRLMARLRKMGRLSEGVICLLLVASIWVGAGSLAQYIFSEFSTPFFLTWLNVSEFVVLLPARWIRESGGIGTRGWLAAPRSDWRGAAKAAAIVCPLWVLAQGTYNVSLTGTSVASSTIFSTTSCLWTFLLSMLVLKERPTWLKALGVAATLSGAALVGWSDEAGTSSSGGDDGAVPNTWWGNLLAALSAVAYALYTSAIAKLVPDELKDASAGAAQRGKGKAGSEAAGPSACAGKTAGAGKGLAASTLDAEEGERSALAAAAVGLAMPDALCAAAPGSEAHADAAVRPSSAAAAAASGSLSRSAGVPAAAPRIHISVFFGFLGLFTTVAFSPLIMGLAATGVEDLSAAARSSSFGRYISLLLVKGLLDNVLSDLLWARAIQLTTPTLSTVALSLTIPLSMLLDFLIHGTIPQLPFVGGAVLVTGGFVASTLGVRNEISSVDAAAAAAAAAAAEEKEESRLVLPALPVDGGPVTGAAAAPTSSSGSARGNSGLPREVELK